MVNDVGGVALSEIVILRKAGYDVHFFHLPAIGATWPSLPKALSIPIRLASYLPAIVRLRRGHYDFLHIHYVPQGLVGLAVGKPFFIHAHGSDLHVNFKSRVKKAVSLKILRRSRAILYVTPNLHEFLKAFEDKAYLVGNPIDPDVFRARPAPSTITKVLIFARLEHIKGADRIFARVEDLSRIVKLTALAWGPWAREYQKRYSKYVDFIDPVSHTEIPSLLQSFDAVIGQMRQGILSLCELEALATGLVVLTGVDQRLYGSDPPPVVQALNGDELISALNRLIGRPDEVNRLSQLGPVWIQRHHSPMSHLQELRRAYTRA